MLCRGLQLTKSSCSKVRSLAGTEMADAVGMRFHVSSVMGAAQDFYNLVDVYLDAVLHPNCVRDPRTFAQEGWHYEIEDAKARPPLTAAPGRSALVLAGGRPLAMALHVFPGAGALQTRSERSRLLRKVASTALHDHATLCLDTGFRSSFSRAEGRSAHENCCCCCWVAGACTLLEC